MSTTVASATIAVSSLLLDDFYAPVRDDGRIDLNFVDDLTWWFGVCYTYDHATVAISADQEAFVDKLLDQYAIWSVSCSTFASTRCPRSCTLLVH